MIIIERNADIYHGNQILLNKMMSLEKKHLKPRQLHSSASQRNGVSSVKMYEFKKINNENKVEKLFYYYIFFFFEACVCNISKKRYKHLLKRLQSANSAYKKENWIKDIKKTEGYLNILGNRTKERNYDYNELVVKTLNEFPVIPVSQRNLKKGLKNIFFV